MNQAEMRLALEWLTVDLGLARLEPSADVPPLPASEFMSVTRTDRELSIVAPWEAMQALHVDIAGPFRAVRVRGTLPLDLVGILVRLAAPLADAGVPIVALSTFDTDYVLVPASLVAAATDAWRRAGITFA